MKRSLWMWALLAVACRPDGSRADSPPAEPAQVAAPASVAVDPAPQAGPVQLDVLPQYGALYVAGPTTLDVLVRLRADHPTAAVRPPLDLAVVIDRSGSMSGEKIRAVKEAALDLLNRLGPADRVTLISYSSDVRVHTTRRPVDEDGRADLRREILGLQASGNTALGPALLSALDLLERAERPEAQMAHVMLLSDGLANAGESRPEVLAARAAQAFVRGVSVSTLGVGLDYNEDLMTKLADQGGGRYHFIRDGGAVASVLGDEMTGLAGTVARGIELDLDGAPGVRVARVFGYAADADDGRARVRVGALAAGQTREILVRLAVTDPGAARIALGRIQARFRDAGGAPGSAEAAPSVARAVDAAAMRAAENPAVTVRAAEVESADRLQLAARATDEGRYDEARDMIRGALDGLRTQQRLTPSPKLAGRISDLEEAAGEVQSAQQGGTAQKAFAKKYKARSYDLMK
jgi:Ca-activated chloride channel family protein